MNHKRCDEIELFRCLLMFFIVLHHTYVHGIFGPDNGMMNLHAWWTILFTSLIAWHVDGFVAISGWFGIKFSWKKFLSLWGLIAFYSCITIGHSILFGRPKFGLSVVAIYGGWFGSSYLMLMLFSPFLNAAVKWLTLQGRRVLCSAMVLLAVGMFFAWVPRHAFSAVSPSGVGSHTFFCMVFVYLIAGSLHKLVPRQISFSKLLRIGLVFPVGIILCGCYVVLLMLVHHLPIDVLIKLMDSLAGDYTAPHVWVFAIVLLMIFLWYVRVPNWLGTICRFVGPSTFGIYLMHDVIDVGKYIYLVPERYMFDQFELHPVMCIVISAFITYCVCLLIDCFRRLALLKLRPMIVPLLDKVDAKWNAIFATPSVVSSSQ